jgi:hypothetical protein
VNLGDLSALDRAVDSLGRVVERRREQCVGPAMRDDQVVHPLDRIGAVEAWHDHAQRIAVLRRQRRVVHLVGE